MRFACSVGGETEISLSCDSCMVNGLLYRFFGGGWGVLLLGDGVGDLSVNLSRSSPSERYILAQVFI